MGLRKLRLTKYKSNPSVGVMELSKSLDISVSQYYKLEQNPQKISALRLKKLSEVLNVTIDEIIED